MLQSVLVAFHQFQTLQPLALLLTSDVSFAHSQRIQLLCLPLTPVLGQLAYFLVVQWRHLYSGIWLLETFLQFAEFQRCYFPETVGRRLQAVSLALQPLLVFLVAIPRLVLFAATVEAVLTPKGVCFFTFLAFVHSIRRVRLLVISPRDVFLIVIPTLCPSHLVHLLL